jgi:hypothetical protein
MGQQQAPRPRSAIGSNCNKPHDSDLILAVERDEVIGIVIQGRMAVANPDPAQAWWIVRHARIVTLPAMAHTATRDRATRGGIERITECNGSSSRCRLRDRQR